MQGRTNFEVDNSEVRTNKWSWMQGRADFGVESSKEQTVKVRCREEQTLE